MTMDGTHRTDREASDLFSSETHAADASGKRASPLSLIQRELWLEAQGRASPDTLAVHLILAGDLNREALRLAFDQLVARHEALRTTFPSIGGNPVAAIGHDDIRLQLEQADARFDTDPPTFDLGQGPLVHARLHRIPSQEHSLSIMLHRIVADHASIHILIDELCELYDAAVAARGSRLPQIMLQHTDYAVRQRHQLGSDRLNEQLSFWKQTLSNPPAPPLTPEPTRSGESEPRFGQVPLVLSKSLTEHLKAVARQQDVSLLSALVASWAMLLGRWTGQEEIIVGSRVSPRRRENALRTVGPLENTVALRISTHRDLTVRQLLRATETTIAQAEARKDIPFQKVVASLGLGDVGCLLQTQVTLSDDPQNKRMQGLRLSKVSIVESQSPFSISLSLSDTVDGLVGALTYARDVVSSDTAERLATAWQVLLAHAIEDSGQCITAPSMLTETERERVIHEYNDTQRAFPGSALVHELFEQQVLRSPDATAVEFEGASLTYAELNRRANQLAHCLRDRGVQPDRLVGVYVERSLEMVIGLLGVLKAGGAYVPLDPSYPTERLDYMIANAAPRVLLVQGALWKDRNSGIQAEVLALDTDWEAIASYSADNPRPADVNLTSRNLAYVIYTSGSTGQPKGAMNEHRAVANRLLWMQDEYRLDSHDRVLQKTPFSFDVSVWEFFWTLLSGARLVMARPQGHQDPSYLRDVIEAAGITTLHFVPSMLQSFLSHHESGACASIERIVCSGEELPLALKHKCLSSLPAARLFNLYGPTEAAVDVTAWECTPHDADTRVPIGQPIANIQMYVLDRHLQAVPIGVAGELYIGGIGVGRGYLNRPALTAERFIADPFGSASDAKLYKTGDLARWRSDGALEYLGRNDHQVKIRGVRIELGEIEARLSTHRQVQECVVVAREEAQGDKRLVAYITAHSDNTPTIDAIRAHLRAGLPEHMVPSAIVVLEKMPLSPNGKLDRRALPAPDLTAYTSKPYEPPETEQEIVLASLWCELLRVERVGRLDNFLELGGHSLLVARMIERLRACGLTTGFRDVLKRPTLREVAISLRAADPPDGATPSDPIPEGCASITPEMIPLVALEPTHIQKIVDRVPGGAANIQDIYPLTPLQEGMLFHHLLEGGRDTSHVLSMLLSVSSAPKLRQLISALQRVVDRHEVLRTAVLWEDLPRPVQVVYRKASLPVEQAKLDARGNAVDIINELLSSRGPWNDIRIAPLVRMRTAASPDGTEWLVLLQIHHLVSDNESLDTLLKEVRAHIQQDESHLSRPPSYRVHVARALTLANSQEAEKFFRDRLGDIEEPTAPFGLGHGEHASRPMEQARRPLAANLATRVRLQARKLSISPATIFHAAWAVLIAHASARNEVVFGTVLLGRLDGNAESQRALGMYINTLPLRLQLDGATSADLIKQTHSELIELVGHEQVSLALAQRCSRIAAPTPLFNALMNYRHSSTDTSAAWTVAPGIEVLSLHDRTNYPLTLSVDEHPEGFVVGIKSAGVTPQSVLSYFVTAMQSLLDALEHAPHTAALALPVLPQAERDRVVHSFNPAAEQFPREMLLHELFEHQVERTPLAPAVVYREESITFEELNQRANRLARYLRTQGVGADQLVGICIERSLDMIVALLAVWKAGGAYVPLDPDYPSERLASILDDARPRALLTQEHLRPRLHSLAREIEILALDSQSQEIASNAVGNLDARALDARPDHLAYVIYTSGSTGRPKGVMVEHRNVISLIGGLEEIYAQSAACQRIGVNASFNFDASVKQLIQVLSGRTLVLLPREVRMDATKLLAYVKQYRVNGIDCTPSQLRAWIDAGLLESSNLDLHVVLVGGEAIDPLLWSRLSQSPAIDFYNVYGPTESTVDTTFSRINGSDTASHIGRPMMNRRVYILNQRREPVPIGVAGELWIGGAGIARGYLNRPELTAERFFPDRFSPEAQARSYRSGDLARWRDDGNIEYLGRADDQVKIRGYRIELIEIEAQLSRHSRVKQCAVVACRDRANELRLVAYVTSDADRPTADSLRSHLRQVLPDYMIPSVVVFKESLPLTPSGKIDRRALSRSIIEPQQSTQYEAPLGDTEETLAAIWQSVLDTQSVSRNDNFFEQGGHSLSAMQLIVRIRAALSIDVPIDLLFKHPVLNELAARLETALQNQLLERLRNGDGELDDMIAELAAMPESRVKELMAEMTIGDQA